MPDPSEGSTQASINPAPVVNGQGGAAPVAGTDVKVDLTDKEKKVNEAAAKKKEARDEAFKTFKKYSDELGGAKNAKAFFDLYGIDGFAPKEKEDSDKKVAERGRELAKEHKIDTAITDHSKAELGLPVRPPGYGAAYLNEGWQIKTIGRVDNPVTLKADAWRIIASSNKIFHGFLMGPSGVTRARFPSIKVETGPNAKVEDLVPDFEVYDSSSISIKESRTEMERSMAHNGFSSLAIQASMSGGALGVSAAASAGYNRERQDSKAFGDFKDRKEYTATYSFPRARVFLDEFNLALTSHCADRLQELRDAVDKIAQNTSNARLPDAGHAIANAVQLRDQFFRRYGQIFAATFQLGGQLTATRSAESLASQKDDECRDAMKVAAALSIESKFVSASASTSVESTAHDRTHTTDLKNSSALAWSARGGNTLLCANPPEWANSVAGFQSWRTLEQEDVYYLPDLIAKLSVHKTRERGGQDTIYPWQALPEAFAIIQRLAYQEIPKVPKGTWTGKIRLVASDGRHLVWKEDKVALSNNTNDADIVFTVLDANIRETTPEPTLNQFLADHPVFLVTGASYGRDKLMGNQIPGLWVDADGSLKAESNPSHKICRWSFRHKGTNIDFKNKWNPDKVVIKNGAQVELYCHSFGCGSYRDPKDPPYFAPSVRRSYNQPDVLHCAQIGTAWWADLMRRVAKAWNEKDDLIQYSQQVKFVFANENNNLQAKMNDFDCGIDIETQTNLEEISTFNKLWGIEDKDWKQLVINPEWRVQVMQGPSEADKTLIDNSDILVNQLRYNSIEGLKAFMNPKEAQNQTVSFRVQFV